LRPLIAVVVAVAAGCDHGGASATLRGPLPAGVVARVGDQDITVAEVARIAAAQHVSATEARDVAVRDRLLARGAEAQGLAGSRATAPILDGELARRLLQRELADARATPPTEAELAEATERRWLEIDRPEGFRTVHALVRLAATDDEPTKHRALALAETIRAVALSISEQTASQPSSESGSVGARTGPNDDPDPLSAAFRKAVAALPADGLQVRAEALPPVSAEGHVLIAGEQYLDPTFARGAAALAKRGAVSPIVMSSYGAHVIVLLERTPALVLKGAERVAKLSDDIVSERARAAEKALLAGLRGRGSVAADAPALLGLVTVDQ
jgi:hypothetical protein